MDFDDLVPQSRVPASGPSFDDLIPPGGTPSTLADVSRSVLSGVDKGFSGLAGSPALAARFIQDTTARGRSLLTGQPLEEIYAENDRRSVVPFSKVRAWSPEGFHEASGLAHEPKTTAGRYAQTGAEFATGTALTGPFNPRNIAMFGVGGGLASEAAGHATEGTSLEVPARIAAGVLAPVAISRAISPVRTDALRQPLVDTLRQEGVSVSAGQASGSKALRYAESTLSDLPFGGQGARELAERQGREFSGAAARRMGETTDNLGPDVMTRAEDRIGGEFRRLSAQNTMVADTQLGNDLGRVMNGYDMLTLPSEQKKAVGDLVSDLVSRIGANSGTLPGETYQALRSNWSTLAKENVGTRYGAAMRGLRDALDSNMGRSIHPDDAAAWQTARREWGNYKTLERAMSGAGEATQAGILSPQALRTAVVARDRGAYVRGEGDFADLARAGAGVMQPLPQSGTAPRSAIQSIVQMLAGGAGAGYATGSAGTGAAVAAAVAAPSMAGRVLMSRPGQAYMRPRGLAAETTAKERVARALLAYEEQKGR